VHTRALALFMDTANAALVATYGQRDRHMDGISLIVHSGPRADHKNYWHQSDWTTPPGESGNVVTLTR